MAVGGFITLEDFGIPVPGETIPIAAAVYAGAGKLNIVAGLIAIPAAVVGDKIGYAVGFFGGHALCAVPASLPRPCSPLACQPPI